jgi:hypothetical protein
MQSFKCCECEKVFFSLPWWGALDTCLKCCAEIEGEDIGRWEVEHPHLESTFMPWA